MSASPDKLALESAPAAAGIGTVRALIAPQMAQLDQVIGDSLRSDVVLINQIAHYIIGGGGKRLRPMIHLLAAGACGYQGDGHAKLAAIIEFIHTATLLHDDVVDESDLRRGQDTANAVWGNAASVLVGDFLYSRSFQMMVELDSMRVMDVLAETTNVIAEGEVLQLLHLHNPDTTEAGYREVIRCKTAKLFEAAARLGAVISASDSATESALAEYGHQLGVAFQLADDMLDYTGAADTLGKNIGDDLAEGKPTLPLIHALHNVVPDERQVLEAAVRDGGRDALDSVIAIIRGSDALDYTWQQALAAASAAKAALEPLADSPQASALRQLCDYAVERRS